MTSEAIGTLWPFGKVDGRDVFECQSCGAIVYGQFTHAEWHHEQEQHATERTVETFVRDFLGLAYVVPGWEDPLTLERLSDLLRRELNRANWPTEDDD